MDYRNFRVLLVLLAFVFAGVVVASIFEKSTTYVCAFAQSADGPKFVSLAVQHGEGGMANLEDISAIDIFVQNTPCKVRAIYPEGGTSTCEVDPGLPGCEKKKPPATPVRAVCANDPDAPGC